MTSVAEVLERLGDWTRVKVLVGAIEREFRISERAAYDQLRKAVERHEIVKAFQPDGGTIYGLPRWGESPRGPESELDQDNGLLRLAKRGFGLFDWLDRRDERKEKRILELRARIAARMEVLCSGETFTYLRFEEALHRHRQEYELEPRPSVSF